MLPSGMAWKEGHLHFFHHRKNCIHGLERGHFLQTDKRAGAQAPFGVYVCTCLLGIGYGSFFLCAVFSLGLEGLTEQTALFHVLKSNIQAVGRTGCWLFTVSYSWPLGLLCFVDCLPSHCLFLAFSSLVFHFSFSQDLVFQWNNFHWISIRSNVLH